MLKITSSLRYNIYFINLKYGYLIKILKNKYRLQTHLLRSTLII